MTMNGASARVGRRGDAPSRLRGGPAPRRRDGLDVESAGYPPPSWRGAISVARPPDPTAGSGMPGSPAQTGRSGWITPLNAGCANTCSALATTRTGYAPGTPSRPSGLGNRGQSAVSVNVVGADRRMGWSAVSGAGIGLRGAPAWRTSFPIRPRRSRARPARARNGRAARCGLAREGFSSARELGLYKSYPAKPDPRFRRPSPPAPAAERGEFGLSAAYLMMCVSLRRPRDVGTNERRWNMTKLKQRFLPGCRLFVPVPVPVPVPSPSKSLSLLGGVWSPGLAPTSELFPVIGHGIPTSAHPRVPPSSPCPARSALSAAGLTTRSNCPAVPALASSK